MDAEIISRQEAKSRGLTHYFTGKRCKRGHLAARSVARKVCPVCEQEYRKVNRELYRKAGRKWREGNPEKSRAASQRYNEANREKRQAANRRYYQDNQDKERARCQEWRLANLGVKASLEMKRHAAKLQRTVPWADPVMIQEHYTFAGLLSDLNGEPYHVDHDVPLQGELVSGLHCEANLRVISGSENCSKNNSFDPLTYEHQLPQ